MNYFARIFVIFIAIYLILFKPLQYAGEIHTKTVNDNVVQITKEFVDSICINKELTNIEYEMFLQKLYRSNSGLIYKVSLCIGELIEISNEYYRIEYDRTEYSRTEHDSHNHTDDYLNGIVSTIHDIEFEELSLCATERTHAHNDGCYFGTAHEHAGSLESGGDCYGTKVSHSHSSSCYAQRKCGQYAANGTNVYYDVKFGKCPSCGKGENTGTIYNISKPSHSFYCSNCSKTVTSSDVLAKHTYYVSKCSGCGGTISIEGSSHITDDHKITDYNNLTCKTPAGTYYKLTCKIKEGYYFNGAEETYDPKCNQVVMSIQPVYAEQTVELGKDMHYGCIATFLDGSQTIIDLSSNYTKKMGTQKVTLTYKGLLYNAKNTGTLTCTAIVNTVKYFDCSECGARYESNTTGKDPGCPVCGKKLLGIKVNALKTVYDNGEVLDIEVTAIYKNKEEKVKGWTSSYNAYISGEQKVTVRYLTESCEITVYVRSGSETVCPICKSSYDKAENNTCPYCSKNLVGILAYTDQEEIMIGEDLPVYIIAEYKDGHFEYIQDGYEISGFNKFVPDIQHVMIQYGGFNSSVIIQVTDNGSRLNICENNHSYLLNKDGTDSGCPYCSLMDDEFSCYLEMSYNEKIMDELYNNGKIIFQSGEYISIEIRCLKLPINIMKDRISYKDADEGELICTYGGRIR